MSSSDICEGAWRSREEGGRPASHPGSESEKEKEKVRSQYSYIYVSSIVYAKIVLLKRARWRHHVQ